MVMSGGKIMNLRFRGPRRQSCPCFQDYAPDGFAPLLKRNMLQSMGPTTLLR